MAEYRLSEEAQEDLENIYRYGYLKFGQRQADEYFDGLVNCFERIALNPEHFPAIDHIKKGYRKCVYMSERIYFMQSEENEIIISAILSRQDETRRL